MSLILQVYPGSCYIDHNVVVPCGLLYLCWLKHYTLLCFIGLILWSINGLTPSSLVLCQVYWFNWPCYFMLCNYVQGIPTFVWSGVFLWQQWIMFCAAMERCHLSLMAIVISLVYMLAAPLCSTLGLWRYTKVYCIIRFFFGFNQKSFMLFINGVSLSLSRYMHI